MTQTPSNAIAAQLTRQQPNQTPAPFGFALVMMCQAKSGAWIVRDAADRRGGVFATAKAARKFVVREFGAAALIVDPARPGTSAHSIAA